MIGLVFRVFEHKLNLDSSQSLEFRLWRSQKVRTGSQAEGLGWMHHKVHMEFTITLFIIMMMIIIIALHLNDMKTEFNPVINSVIKIIGICWTSQHEDRLC